MINQLFVRTLSIQLTLFYLPSSCIYLLSSESPVSLKFEIHKILFPFLCCCFCIFAFRTNFALTLTRQIMYYIKKHLQSWETRINMCCILLVKQFLAVSFVNFIVWYKSSLEISHLLWMNLKGRQTMSSATNWNPLEKFRDHDDLSCHLSTFIYSYFSYACLILFHLSSSIH